MQPPEKKQINEYEVTPEIETFTKEKLTDLFQKAGFNGDIKTTRKPNNTLLIEINNVGEDAGRLIGKNASTQRCLQILLNQFIYQKFRHPIRINLDIEGYRNRHNEKLKAEAIKASKIVIREGKEVPLPPMNALDRRTVHLIFENDKKIQSLSEGEGVNRRVVLIKRPQTQ